MAEVSANQKHIFSSFLWAGVFIFSLVLSPLSALAAPGDPTVFNTDPLDFETVRVSNFSQHPFSTTDWVNSVSALPGEIVAVGIYYHNSGNEDALNTIVNISVPLGVEQSSFTASGSVSADNAPIVSGTANIDLPSDESLSYVPGSARWYPNQIQDPNQGVVLPDYAVNNLGTIAPGFPSQGMVIAQFQVSSTTAPQAFIDVLANDSQGPLSISENDQFSLSWTSNDVISCELSSTDGVVFTSGVSTTGSTSPMDATHPYFPTVGESRTFEITCETTGGQQISDTVTVSVVAPAGPGLPAPTLTAQISAQCGGLIDLSWNTVASSTQYKIFRDGSQIATTSNTSFTDGGLVPGSSHSYTVVASDGVVDSDPSNTATAMASAGCVSAPAAPVITTTTGPACGGQITVSWSQVTDANIYKIFRDNFLIASTTNLSFTDTGLTPGQTYTYTVTAGNNTGDSALSNSSQSQASSACVGAPTIPQNVQVLTGPLCGGQILITWSAVADALTYTVTRDGVDVSTFSASSTMYIDTGLTPGTAYSYSVRAGNSAGNSPPSVPVSGFASGQCVGPIAGPTLSGSTGANCGGEIVLSWTPVAGVNAYKIFRSFGGVTAQVGTTTNLSFTDAGLTTGATYQYFIIATVAGIDSTPSNTVTVISSAACVPTTPPLAPTLTATTGPACGGQIALSWTSSATATSYEVHRNNVLLATTTNLSFTDTGLAIGQTFSYTVAALNSVGSSTPSNIASAASSAACGGGGGGGATTTPSFTLNVNTGNQCGGSVEMSWAAFASTTATTSFYEIYRDGALVASTTSLSFTDTGLATGNDVHSYMVRAITTAGTSADSNTTSTTASGVCGGSSGGGGGGGGGGGSSSSSGSGTRIISTTPIFPCEYLRDYLRIDLPNDPVEVLKLQIFLRNIEGEAGVPISGTFDQATFDAVARFQVKYQPSVLTPWGYEQGEFTGYVYILTKKRINEIVCNTIYPLTSGQLNEIAEFKNFIEALRSQGIQVPDVFGTGTGNGELGSAVGAGSVSTSTATTSGAGGIVSNIVSNDNVRAVAAAVFAGPENVKDGFKAAAIFLLILLAAYVLADQALKRRFKTEDKDKERVRRLSIVSGLLVLTMIIAAILGYYVIILPLIIFILALLAFVLWLVSAKRKEQKFLQERKKGFSDIPPTAIILPPSMR